MPAKKVKSKDSTTTTQQQQRHPKLRRSHHHRVVVHRKSLHLRASATSSVDSVHNLSSSVASPSPSVTKPKKTSKKTKTSSSITSGSASNSSVAATSAPIIPQASIPPSSQIATPVTINYAQQAVPLAFPPQFANKNTNPTPPSNVEVPYSEEISKMLMVFCYTSRIEPNGNRIIERYTRNHLIQLISTACEQIQKSATQTDSSITISPDDILFLFKNNSLKLARIENLIKVKEMRKKDEESTSESDPKKRKLTAIPLLKEKKIKYDPILEIGHFSDDEDLENEKSSYDPFATYMHEKRKAADFLTKCMTTNEYMEFTKNRESANMLTKGTKKFRQWLDVSNDIKMNDLVLEILAMEAFETIGILCQVALIVAIDSQNRRISPFEDALFKYAGLLSERARRMYSQHPQDPIDLATSKPVPTVNNSFLTNNHFLSAITLLHPPSCGKHYNPLKFIVNI
ncbi:predicted protein [Naegleria gruberi]|uniref:Predicted protein n=1 Tax=Naegleria gruberi TaxID=5762 RepID=D2VRF1_NAEGR|nr:uncharacterized protein NAEGRDRAFT_51665 [Naegleria gruberi]EFC40596.1 predicted protein [Naegleria gruberi]|eukprot:XP_002673340.1 predicted protein [Naegleria gruberi strain NEG-M]